MSEPLKLYGNIWLGDESSQLGDLRISLLEQIDATGSITKAAKAVGISYKTAWDTVDALKNITGDPLVASASGGRYGGGTRLTDAGRRLVETYRLIQREHERFLASMAGSLGGGKDDFRNSYQIIRRLSMKSSARNQFFGKVERIRPGLINSEIEIGLKGGDRIVAIITHESHESLGLQPGSEVWALVKASWVILATDDSDAKLSVRNRLCGKVTRLTRGQVNSDVVLTLSGGNTVSAVVTNESIEQMELEEGAQACALFKASSVILGIAA